MCEPLERRSLLAVTFTAGAYAQPANRADLIIAPFPGSFPESVAKINPTDAANIAIGVGASWGFSTNGVAGLSTLTGPIVPPVPPGFVNTGGDPDLAFDAQGRLYFGHLVIGSGAGSRRVAVEQWNPKTGAIIGAPSVIPSTPGQSNDDKPFLAADANANSPHANNLYVVWDRFGVTPGQWEVYFARSTDQGQTWTNVQQLSHFFGPNGVPGDADDEGSPGPPISPSRQTAMSTSPTTPRRTSTPS
jgi:hypothetical protein